MIRRGPCAKLMQELSADEKLALDQIRRNRGLMGDGAGLVRIDDDRDIRL
jgi:hypothetical protein